MVLADPDRPVELRVGGLVARLLAERERLGLERLLAGPIDPGWRAEDQDFKRKGEKLLQTLK